VKGLQGLKLGYDQKADLYLKKHVYLDQLADLKQLRIFDLVVTPHETFGEQEVLWMAMNWPKLLLVYDQGAPMISKRLY